MSSIIRKDLDEQVRLGKIEMKTGNELLEIVKSFGDDIEKSVYEDLDETEKSNFAKSVDGFVPVDAISMEDNTFNKSIKHETLYIREVKKEEKEATE